MYIFSLTALLRLSFTLPISPAWSPSIACALFLSVFSSHSSLFTFCMCVSVGGFMFHQKTEANEYVIKTYAIQRKNVIYNLFRSNFQIKNTFNPVFINVHCRNLNQFHRIISHHAYTLHRRK